MPDNFTFQLTKIRLTCLGKNIRNGFAFTLFNELIRKTRSRPISWPGLGRQGFPEAINPTRTIFLSLIESTAFFIST